MDEEEAMGRDWKESWLSTELAFSCGRCFCLIATGNMDKHLDAVHPDHVLTEELRSASTEEE